MIFYCFVTLVRSRFHPLSVSVLVPNHTLRVHEIFDERAERLAVVDMLLLLLVLFLGLDMVFATSFIVLKRLHPPRNGIAPAVQVNSVAGAVAHAPHSGAEY